MKSIFLFLVFMANLVFVQSIHAGDNTCWLMAPTQNDVWVIVYDADADGNRGKTIWKGKISAGQKVQINSTDGHIRYNFKRDINQPYEGDIATGCYQNKIIQAD